MGRALSAAVDAFRRRRLIGPLSARALLESLSRGLRQELWIVLPVPLDQWLGAEAAVEAEVEPQTGGHDVVPIGANIPLDE